MLRYIALGLLFTSFSAFAAGPVVDGVIGASNTQFAGTNNATVTIFGGVSGLTCTPDSGSVTETCSSCTGTYDGACLTPPLCPCNTVRIRDGMTLQINFKDDTANPYNIVAQNVSSGAGTNFPPLTSSNGGNFADFNWTAICTAVGATSCDTAAANATALTSLTLRVGFDKNVDGQLTSGEESTDITIKVIAPPDTYGAIDATNTSGIDAFVPYPGDEKIILENLHASGGFPNLAYATGTSRARKVRVYFSKVALANATPSQAEFEQDLDLNNDSSGDFTETPIVDALDNDDLYYFRIGLVDEGGNSVQYFPDLTACTDPTQACPYSATPSQVLGLLSKDMNCFIATAAYGSALDAHLNTFREFRHKFLLLNPYGRKFVDTYYKYGPYAARYISDKPALRAITRGLLWPAYAFSYAALKIGFAAAFAATLLILTALLALPGYGIRRWRSRV